MLLPINLLLFISIAYTSLQKVSAWQKWEYASNTKTPEDWQENTGFSRGPRARRGHSLIVHDETKLVMFGGRDDDVWRYHNTCNSFANVTSSENSQACSNSCKYDSPPDLMKQDSEQMREEAECGYIPVGVYFNDVWTYDLNCTRYGDFACIDSGWQLIHPGAIYGGCRINNGTRVCDTPAERWRHGAAMLNNNSMLVYGGFSHECEDYCDDLWSFDLKSGTWTEIYPVGHSANNNYSNPGKRWRFSFLGATNETQNSFVILFGGHRSWHGFASDNSFENSWESDRFHPKGGYLDDMWIFSNDLTDDSVKTGTWSRQEPKESCDIAPGATWESRNDELCRIYWPRGRAGHAVAYDKRRNGMWLFGGYTSHYPYMSSHDPGSDYGTQSLQGKGFVPYPTYPYFLADLWFFDLETGIWTEKRSSEFSLLFIIILFQNRTSYFRRPAQLSIFPALFPPYDNF